MKLFNKYPTTGLFTLYILIIVLILLSATLTSCTTQNKFKKLATVHKDWLAEECSIHFPPKETVDVKSDTTEADNSEHDRLVDSLEKLAQKPPIIVRDSIYLQTDCNRKLREQDKAIKDRDELIKALKKEPCKPSYIRINTTYTVVDKAKEFLLEKERDSALKGKNRAEVHRNWATGIALILLALHFIRRRI